MIKSYLWKPDKEKRLSDYSPTDTCLIKSKEDVREHTSKLKEELSELQSQLFAQKQYSLLIIFQGMDCSGKDGTIRKVLSGINPQGFRAVSFKKPTEEEAAHDFLWRTHSQTPARGYITAFNRSYYEEVLITRVHGQIDKKEAKRRFELIRHFEELLAGHDTVVLKLFLHISKGFQMQKIRQRLEDPAKAWKFDPNDLAERKYWDEYQQAYEDVFNHCSDKQAPWYIVPSDNRWFRDYLVLSIITDALRKLPLAYPRMSGAAAEAAAELGVSLNH
ncbi:polyphosphate:nucleotide phosphotransferase, PPK2 family [Paenibacillus sp. UNCCL117]|uniref:PPK2 family polyphosphate kinase n=1 Tax=unclassified Paenibacillus TaxID=185978 RepID=UPI000885E794|nr:MULTISPECIES: PPK2 family polyphosphate kinase [unclassified Paenibacillus]SDD57867.1 polyphosphate:nucleotide phosphotransferase, PPK2 family [Paenibacillus sp. cl123]SFW51110.1 polyphosphate:nucleotide phosphotransferase, PPK2 family [Paenibacillus sp. UNCCL117]